MKCFLHLFQEGRSSKVSHKRVDAVKTVTATREKDQNDPRRAPSSFYWPGNPAARQRKAATLASVKTETRSRETGDQRAAVVAATKTVTETGREERETRLASLQYHYLHHV